MALSIKRIREAHDILEKYNGNNPLIIKVKNIVLVYKTRAMNDFECAYVLANHGKEPKLLNKIVKIADWFGLDLQLKWNTEFTPQKLKVTWLIGETETLYHFYCICRRSQTTAVEVFAPKKAILTQLEDDGWEKLEIDFKPYNERSGLVLYPHQEEAVRFLVAKKKAILAHSMGHGKTASAIVAALESKYEKILVICPQSMKASWVRELSRYVDSDEITTVEGSKWKENKFTIINYEILKNFYEVPTEIKKEKELNLNDDGKIVEVTKERETVSKRKSVIDNAMSNSQLFQSKFDLVIIDEAHRLSNTKSGIFKIVSDLVKRSNPRGIYAITGTPITNRPINFFNMLKIINSPIAKDWEYYVRRYCDGKQIFNAKEKKAYTAMFLRSIGKYSWYDLTPTENDKLLEYLEAHCKKLWLTNGASHLDELQEVIKPYYIRRDKSDIKTLVNKSIKVLEYELDDDMRAEYENVWNEYLMEKGDTSKSEKFKRITEGIVFRQWLANHMIPYTIRKVEELVEQGHKVVVFTSFDNELYELQSAFGDSCVIHNGKLSALQKTRAVDEFQNNSSKKVFIGNIFSAGVGLTLVASDTVIFNSITFVPGDMLQAEDRIHRLNQDKDCTVYYQVFKDTYMEHMFDIVHGKSEIIDKLIISEKDKH
jgi:SWI/SNF-related matrix-associated actin-dependent regulator 1 of chromatin subfamily A